MDYSDELFNRARRLLPGGVNSPVRAFHAVGGVPRFIAYAQGCTLTDVEGKEYIDYIGSWGPMILGHLHPEIANALEQALSRGTSFGTPCPDEVELAEEIVERVPSVERVRFVNSGTEATMSAIRLARAATGRNVIVKFDGCYHGHGDSFLIKAGSGVATLGLPNSPGVTPGTAQDTRVAPFNALTDVIDILSRDGDQIAAIIVEPVAGNMGVVPPVKEFLCGLRELCDQHGSLLIFDEVMTGFRLARGGAQELYDIRPDLSTFGKVIGGGLPVGAYGGRTDLMNLVAPAGPVYQAGTLSGNPLAMAAGLATLRQLGTQSYEILEKQSAKLADGLTTLCQEAGIEATVQRVGSMLTLFFHPGPIQNMQDASAADHKRFAAFFNAMLEQGVHLPPSGYEAWFVSLAHNDDVIEKTLDAARASLASL